MEAQWLMLQADKPDDYIVATNKSATVSDFLSASFGALDLDWEKHVEFDSRYLRPTEVDALVGDYSKAKLALSWQPSVLVDELAHIMVQRDLELLARTELEPEIIKWRY